MKKNYVFIFLNKESVSVYTYNGKEFDNILKTCSIKKTEHCFKVLDQFNTHNFVIFASFEQAQIKSFSLSGFNIWYKHQLTKRIYKDYSHYDWLDFWHSQGNINILYGYLTKNEKLFFNTLIEKKYKIQKLISNIKILDSQILKNTPITASGIVTAPINKHFEHLLYFDNALKFAKTDMKSSSSEWQSFMKEKHSETLEVLNAEEFIKSHSSQNSFEEFAIKNYSLCPSITLNKSITLRKTYTSNLFLKKLSLFLLSISLVFTVLSIQKWLNIHPKIQHIHQNTTHLNTLTSLLSKKFDLKSAADDINNYSHAKRFEESKLPFLKILDHLSSILPKYGKVIAIDLNAKIPDFQNNINSESYAINILITPFKSSKHLSLLNTELTQKLGKSLKIHLSKKASINTSRVMPSATVSINIVGLKNEITTKS